MDALKGIFEVLNDQFRYKNDSKPENEPSELGFVFDDAELVDDTDEKKSQESSESLTKYISEGANVNLALTYCRSIPKAITETLDEIDIERNSREEIKTEIQRSISDSPALYPIIGFAFDLMDAAFPDVDTLEDDMESKAQSESSDSDDGFASRSTPICIPGKASPLNHRKRSTSAKEPTKNSYTTSGPIAIGSGKPYGSKQQNGFFGNSMPANHTSGNYDQRSFQGEVHSNGVFEMSLRKPNDFNSFRPGGGGKFGGGY